MQAWLKANGGPPAVVIVSLGLLGLTPLAWIGVAAGLALNVLSWPAVRRRVPWAVVRRTDLDSRFWEKVFDALPSPAFIKEYPKDAHVWDNRALITFQGRKPQPSAASDELHALICSDHQEGDKQAFDFGSSAQLELTDRVPTKRPRPILTLKTRVDHDEKTYIVGTYWPVKPPSTPPTGNAMDVAEAGGQVLFPSLAPAGDEGDRLVIMIGQAIRSMYRQPPNSP